MQQNTQLESKQESKPKSARNFIISTIRAGHLTSRMKLGDEWFTWRILQLLGNKDGQRFFRDDEVYVRVPEEALNTTGRVVIVHSGAPDPNGGIVELEMILSVLKKAGVHVEIFFAYFGYGRQDHAFHPGECNAAREIIEKFVQYYGVKRIYVLDAHFAGQDWVNEYPIALVSALILLEEAASKDYPDVIYKAPDEGSQRRTKLEGTKKKRTNSVTVSIEATGDFGRAVKGKVIGAVDDLVSTGHTLAEFAQVCIDFGADAVIALLTHGALVEGIKLLKARFNKVYLTNSIDREDSNVDVSGLILKTIIAGW